VVYSRKLVLAVTTWSNMYELGTPSLLPLLHSSNNDDDDNNNNVCLLMITMASVYSMD
jgi:hypothetical protein